MTIAFPDELCAELEREAQAAGIPSVDEYVLIMYTRAKCLFGVNGESWWADESDGEPTGPPWADPEVQERLSQLVEEGLNSGPPIRVTLPGSSRSAR
jgi:hypothetical protein